MRYLLVCKDRPRLIDVFSVQTLDATILSAVTTLIKYDFQDHDDYAEK